MQSRFNALSPSDILSPVKRLVLSRTPVRVVPSGERRHGLGRIMGRRSTWLVVAGFISLQAAAIARAAGAQAPSPGCDIALPYLASAQAALTAADSATALEKLNRAIELDPKCADAYLVLGLTEFQRGETAQSIQDYKRSLELQPRSYSAHYNLALAYVRQHELQEARLHLEQAVKLDAHQADAAYDLGIVLLELGEPSAALAPLRHSRTLNPRRPDVAFNIVRAQIEAGHIGEARTEAEASAKHFGSDPKWSTALGELFLKNAQPEDATVYFREANRIRPDDTEIRHQLAVAYLESRQPDDVLSTITKPETPDDHYLRASAYYLSHRLPEADQESGLALALAPDNSQILVLRTRLMQRAGDQHGALEMAQKAIALAPQWDEPYYLAGVSYYFIRHYEEADQNLTRALTLNPSSTRALFLEAMALASQGKIDDAELCLRRAIALQPKNARFHCHLGILLARRNEPAKAEDSFREAIELKPDYALSHYELGKLLVSSKQLRQAAQELDQAVIHDPGLGSAYYQLASVYARLGETEKSARCLANFQRLSRQQTNDSQSVDQTREEDARKETESP
jgi:protein O-GlcNAc transferase